MRNIKQLLIVAALSTASVILPLTNASAQYLLSTSQSVVGPPASTNLETTRGKGPVIGPGGLPPAPANLDPGPSNVSIATPGGDLGAKRSDIRAPIDDKMQELQSVQDPDVLVPQEHDENLTAINLR